MDQSKSLTDEHHFGIKATVALEILLMIPSPPFQIVVLSFGERKIFILLSWKDGPEPYPPTTDSSLEKRPYNEQETEHHEGNAQRGADNANRYRDASDHDCQAQ